MESILTSIKKLLGISESDTNFDVDVTIHINSVLSILNQLGVGPTEGFLVVSKFNTWDEFVDDETTIEFIKTYIYLKVKLIFDPPLSSSVIEAYNRTISELEWRIQVAAEPDEEESEV